MRAEEIREVQRAQPFRPFVLKLVDGRRFVIEHPEFMFVSRNNRTIVIDDIDGSIELIDPMLVVSVGVRANESQSAS